MILGMGVDPAHLHVVHTHPRRVDELTALIRQELEHHGLSVIIAVRECIEAARRRKSAEHRRAAEVS
jgi:indolepyruvate ferredoxin oxidoreductase alpha subunit